MRPFLAFSDEVAARGFAAKDVIVIASHFAPLGVTPESGPVFRTTAAVQPSGDSYRVGGPVVTLETEVWDYERYAAIDGIEDELRHFRPSGARTLQAWHLTKDGSVALLREHAERLYGSRR